jgi:hypothetical protein
MRDAQHCIEQRDRYHEEFGVDYFTMRLRMVEGPSLEKTAERSNGSVRRSYSRLIRSIRRRIIPRSPPPPAFGQSTHCFRCERTPRGTPSQALAV